MLCFFLLFKKGFVHSLASLLGSPGQLHVNIKKKKSNQPPTWQQLSAFWHVDMVNTAC